MYELPAVFDPPVCCAAGVAPKKPIFCVDAVPIWSPVDVPSGISMPSRIEPQTWNAWRLSVIDVMVELPATTVARRTWAVLG